MNVTEAYLKDFALPAILKQPTVVTLNTWEEEGDWSITMDDEDGHSLSILYCDEYPAEAQWKIKQGDEKRWTLVRLTKDGHGMVGTTGWEFEGLYTPMMLKIWFMQHLKMKPKVTTVPTVLKDGGQ